MLVGLQARQTKGREGLAGGVEGGRSEELGIVLGKSLDHFWITKQGQGVTPGQAWSLSRLTLTCPQIHLVAGCSPAGVWAVTNMRILGKLRR